MSQTRIWKKRAPERQAKFGKHHQRARPPSSRAKVADILTASFFFFEPNFADTNFGYSTADGRYELKGSIRCRLARNSQELKRLVNLVKGFWKREIHKTTLSLDGNDWTPIKLTDNWRHAVRTEGAWFNLNCTIRTYEPTEMQQVIAVSLLPPKVEGNHYSHIPLPISGFPISFEELQRKAKST